MSGCSNERDKIHVAYSLILPSGVRDELGGYLTSVEPASIESETALKLKASGLAKVESAVIKQINQRYHCL